MEERLTIGDLAHRSGVAASALRYWEGEGLITSERTSGNQRRYARITLRRVALIRAAQQAGLTINEVKEALSTLDPTRVPTPDDWQRLSETWREAVEARIAALAALRDQITDCIGCGCLSLRRCGLINQGDRAAALGPGPRYLMGDPRPEPSTG
jgi:MerR family transcriptional regulator, redox-sensitive transcriptional activator SoxR